MDQDDRAVYIYVLSESDTGQVRYVGSTVNPDERLKGHVGRSTSTQVQAWVRELSRRGAAPVMRVIDTVPAERRDVVERRWIRRVGRRTALINTRWVNGKPSREQHARRTRPTPRVQLDGETRDILLRLPLHLAETLDRLTQRYGTDRSSVIRMVIAEWAETRGEYVPPVPPVAEQSASRPG